MQMISIFIYADRDFIFCNHHNNHHKKSKNEQFNHQKSSKNVCQRSQGD